MGNEDAFEKSILDVAEIIKKYENMTLPDKLKAKGKLERDKESLLEKISDIEVDLIVLGRMPDVANYRVERDPVAGYFLSYLRKRGDTSYEELVEGEWKEARMTIPYYLQLLERAEHIKLVHNEDGSTSINIL